MSQSKPGKSRRRLAPSEKYEVYVQVLTQQATQREAAEAWGVDRSTIVAICRTAKPNFRALGRGGVGVSWGGDAYDLDRVVSNSGGLAGACVVYSGCVTGLGCDACGRDP